MRGQHVAGFAGKAHADFNNNVIRGRHAWQGNRAAIFFD